MKILKPFEKINKREKPVFKVVRCKNCKKRVAIEEGDGIGQCDGKKDRGSVQCPSCKKTIIFKLRFPDWDDKR